MASFEEGLGRIMFVAGALEHERPFLGPLYKFLTMHPSGFHTESTIIRRVHSPLLVLRDPQEPSLIYAEQGVYYSRMHSKGGCLRQAQREQE